MGTITVEDYAPHEGQRKFHADSAKIRLLNGAWRAGKSHALLWEAVYMGLRTAERAGPGATFAMFRKTGPALADTLLRDFDRMVPPALVSGRSNSVGRLSRTLHGGTTLQYRSLDDWRKQGGGSYDGIFLDEGWEFEAIDFDMLLGRLSGKFGPRRMVVATNPPTRNHWLYDRFVKNARPGTSVHTFTTYMNAANLPADYIPHLEATLDEARKRRFLWGEWGFTTDNEPVFSEFRESTHTADLKLQPVRDAFLLCGWDFGYHHPAVAISQLLPTGHVQVLRELLGSKIDVRAFGQQVRELLELHFPRVPVVHYCDRAGVQKNDLGTSSILELQKMGFTFRYRQMSIMRTIDQMRDLIRTLHLGVPLLRINRTGCPLLVEALAGGYGMDAEKDEPCKDGFYDHLVDALRYSVVPAVYMAGGGVKPIALPSRRARVAV